MALGDDKHLIVVKLGNGSYQMGLGLRTPEGWSSENAALIKDSSALRKFLLHDHFADWSQVHTDLIQHSDGDLHAWPLYSVPAESLPWKTVPGVTLIGDAAHLT